MSGPQRGEWTKALCFVISHSGTDSAKTDSKSYQKKHHLLLHAANAEGIEKQFAFSYI